MTRQDVLDEGRLLRASRAPSARASRLRVPRGAAGAAQRPVPRQPLAAAAGAGLQPRRRLAALPPAPALRRAGAGGSAARCRRGGRRQSRPAAPAPRAASAAGALRRRARRGSAAAGRRPAARRPRAPCRPAPRSAGGSAFSVFVADRQRVVVRHGRYGLAAPTPARHARGSALPGAPARVALVDLAIGDLLLQLHDGVQQRVRPRRAARDVHVDRQEVVDARHRAVRALVRPAGGGAHAHRDHVLRGRPSGRRCVGWRAPSSP